MKEKAHIVADSVSDISSKVEEEANVLAKNIESDISKATEVVKEAELKILESAEKVERELGISERTLYRKIKQYDL